MSKGRSKFQNITNVPARKLSDPTPPPAEVEETAETTDNVQPITPQVEAETTAETIPTSEPITLNPPKAHIQIKSVGETKTRRHSLMFRPSVLERAQRTAARQGLSLTEWVNRIMDEAADR